MPANDGNRTPRPACLPCTPICRIHDARDIKGFQLAGSQNGFNCFSYLWPLRDPCHVRGEDSFGILLTVANDVAYVAAVPLGWRLVSHYEHLVHSESAWIIRHKLQNRWIPENQQTDVYLIIIKYFADSPLIDQLLYMRRHEFRCRAHEPGRFKVENRNLITVRPQRSDFFDHGFLRATVLSPVSGQNHIKRFGL